MKDSKPTDTSKWPTGNGATHSQAQTVDLSTLTKFLRGLGYEPIQLEQRWRHVHGVLTYGESKFFFKLASTPEIGVKTANEIAWNTAVAEPLLELSGGVVVVPHIRNSGTYEGCVWYIADFYKGEFPADHDPPSTEALPSYLSSLAHVAVCLHRLNIDSLWGGGASLGNEVLISRFFEDVDLWMQDAGRSDLDEIRALVEPLRDSYLPRVSHGDFVPWHIIIHDDKRVLIDGEHGFSGRPTYYDIAYFYHRLATSAARPDLARRFLAECTSRLSHQEQQHFDALFLPVLASRSIAGFYDATLFADQRSVLDRHEELKAMILSRKY